MTSSPANAVPLNALMPISVSESLKTTAVSSPQPLKAPIPIEVSPEGSVTLVSVSFTFSANLSPMMVTV